LNALVMSEEPEFVADDIESSVMNRVESVGPVSSSASDAGFQRGRRGAPGRLTEPSRKWQTGGRLPFDSLGGPILREPSLIEV
jgi:hypothetical protein